jgi:hypothetical protein
MIAMSEACVTAGRISARDGFDQTVVAGPWPSLLPAVFGLFVLYRLLGIGALSRRRYARSMGCARRSYQPRDAEPGVLHEVIRDHLDEFLRAADVCRCLMVPWRAPTLRFKTPI